MGNYTGQSSVQEFYKDKVVAITGAAGSVGKTLVSMLLDLEVRHVICLDNNEAELFQMTQENAHHEAFEAFLCDITDLETLRYFLTGVDYVFHMAAFKNVPVCENSPSLAVRTNILGTENVITACRSVGVKKVIFTSSDKAVNPPNVMGTTKLMGERLITAANAMAAPGSTIFSSTRFGNVAGSRGSVVPVFMNQIAEGGPLTLTDPDMTRFIMTVEEANELILESMILAKGGEVFVTKMPVVKLPDLAEQMVEYVAPHLGKDPKDVQMRVIGHRPGEKLFEELVTVEEARRTYEIGDFLVVLPAISNVYNSADYEYYTTNGVPNEEAYTSHNQAAMNSAEVRTFIEENSVVQELLAKLK